MHNSGQAGQLLSALAQVIHASPVGRAAVQQVLQQHGQLQPQQDTHLPQYEVEEAASTSHGGSSRETSGAGAQPQPGFAGTHGWTPTRSLPGASTTQAARLQARTVMHQSHAFSPTPSMTSVAHDRQNHSMSKPDSPVQAYNSLQTTWSHLSDQLRRNAQASAELLMKHASTQAQVEDVVRQLFQ
jgi:hypothetical protein